MSAPRRALGALDRLERRAPVVGVVLIALAFLVFAVSWTANQGLPLNRGPETAVLVPDAAQLTKGDEARVGGARVGRVTRVEAVTDRGRIVARVTVRLDRGQSALPVDSTAAVVPVNLFGAKALQLERGRATRTVPAGEALGIDRARTTVDLSDVLADVDGTLGARLRAILDEAGTAVAGRGTAIAELVPRTADLLPPARRITSTLADPATRLSPLLGRADDVAGLLDGLRGDLPRLLVDAGRTLAALEDAGPALEATLERTPRTAVAATRALRRATPVLADLRTLADALRPGIDRLPGTVAAAERVVDQTGRTLAPGTGVPRTARSVARLLGDAATLRPGATRVLGDLREVSSPLERLMTTLGDAEVHCNVGGLLARNLPAAVSGGDRAGAWLTGQAQIDVSTLLPAERQAADLHHDPYPRADAGGCAAANQLFRPGRRVGPAASDDVVLGLRAPAEATERARRAGLLRRYEGADR